MTHAAEMRSSGAVPARLNRFVGRGSELDDLLALLVRDRQVTVTGPGGSGKTSLAMALAAAEVDARGRARMVELATTHGREAVIRSLFESFAVAVEDEVVGMRRVRSVIGTDPMLLVIDNAEHVVAPVAWIVGQLGSLPHLRIVVTSRTPLRTSTEHVWLIPPLRPSDAAELLRDRTRAELTDDEVEQVCRAADGLPLAIELVAAQFASMGVERVIGHLSRLHAVAGNGGPDRHHSIAAALEASYTSLGRASRTTFRALSVPAGGCGIDLARDCAGLADGIGHALDGLVVSSLISATRSRYRMVEPVRQYAAELLDRAGEREIVEARFVQSITTFAAQAAAGWFTDPGHWSHMVKAERANIVQAIDIAIGRGMNEDALRIVARLGAQWGTFQTELGYRLSRRVLDSCQGTEQPRLVGRALASTANLGSLLEPSGDWAPMFERAVDVLDGCGDRKGLGMALYWYARFGADVSVLDRAIDVAEDADNASLLAWSLMNKATILVEHGHPLPPSLVLLERAQSVARDAGLPVVLATALMRTVSCREAGRIPGDGVVVADDLGRAADEAEAIMRELGNDWQRYEVAVLQARLRLVTLDVAAAVPFVREAIDRAVACRSGALVAEAIRLAASVTTYSGRPGDAASLTELAATVAGRPVVTDRNAGTEAWNPRWHPFFWVQLHLANDETANESVYVGRLEHAETEALALLG